VAEPDHDVGEQLQPVALLVRDKDSKLMMIGFWNGWENGSLSRVAP